MNIPTLLDGIVDYLLVATVVAGILTPVIWGIIKLARIRTPIYRHMVWLYLLIVIVVLPLIWLHGPKLTLTVLPARTAPAAVVPSAINSGHNVEVVQNMPVESRLERPLSSAMSAQTSSKRAHPFPLKTVLITAWLVGVVFMLARLVVGFIRLRRICLTAQPVEPLRIENVIVLASSQISGPVCCGFRRPTILLPKQLVLDNNENDMQMVLNHETAHIERKDCWVNLVQRIIEAFFFFNPFIWYVSRQLTQECEQICDNYVLIEGASQMNYINLLSRIVEHNIQSNRLQAVAMVEGRLLPRIRSLLDPKRNTQTKASLRATIIGLIAFLICIIPATVQLEAKSISPSQIASAALISADSNSRVATDTNSAAAIRPQEEKLGPSGNRPKGNCSISGKVISALNDKPVDKATVYLFCTVTHDAIFITPASDGSFEFKDIPAGGYSLQVIHTPGFQNQQYNPENTSGQQLAWFTIKDSEQRSGVVFKLVPAYTISGKVFDENGNPYNAEHASVKVWHQSTKDGGPGGIFNPNGHPSKISSDGSYLIEALDGSPVYVMVYDYDTGKKEVSYPPCYYPGTVMRSQAKPITFDSLHNVQGADIHLKKTSGLALKGTVVDESGKPIPEAFVVASHRETLFDFVTAYTNEQGTYEIQGVSDGEFLVHVDAAHRGFVRARTPIDINSTNKTTQLNFTLKRGVTISGRFVDEQGNAWSIGNSFGSAYIKDYQSSNSQFSQTGFRNKYAPSDIRRNSPGAFQVGEGDYGSSDMIFLSPTTFVLQGMMPGQTSINFAPQKQGQVVKQILCNGQNIMETGIETTAGQDVNDIRIVIGSAGNV